MRRIVWAILLVACGAQEESRTLRAQQAPADTALARLMEERLQCIRQEIDSIAVEWA